MGGVVEDARDDGVWMYSDGRTHTCQDGDEVDEFSTVGRGENG